MAGPGARCRRSGRRDHVFRSYSRVTDSLTGSIPEGQEIHFPALRNADKPIAGSPWKEPLKKPQEPGFKIPLGLLLPHRSFRIGKIHSCEEILTRESRESLVDPQGEPGRSFFDPWTEAIEDVLLGGSETHRPFTQGQSSDLSEGHGPHPPPAGKHRGCSGKKGMGPRFFSLQCRRRAVAPTCEGVRASKSGDAVPLDVFHHLP